MAAPFPSPRIKAFISYSHADAKYLTDLKIHLASLTREGKVEVWDDTKITPGMPWFEEIKQALRTAKVAIFLVSPNFLASDFIAAQELPALLAAARQEGALILSIILRPCLFNQTELANYQTVNPPSQPLAGMSLVEQDQVWVRVAELVTDGLKAKQPLVAHPHLAQKVPDVADASSDIHADSLPDEDTSLSTYRKAWGSLFLSLGGVIWNILSIYYAFTPGTDCEPWRFGSECIGGLYPPHVEQNLAISLLAFFPAVIAFYMGQEARKELRLNPGTPGNMRAAEAGIVLAWLVPTIWVWMLLVGLAKLLRNIIIRD